ncbi:MAG: MmgE/PrpD family protein [Bryobacteraceae bacterium]
MKIARRTVAAIFAASIVAAFRRAAGEALRVSNSAARPASKDSPPPVTQRVSEFVVKTRYEDVPADVIELGKKSILDGLGLALAGSVSKTGEIACSYLQSLGLSRSDATVIGTNLRVPVRFAAFANGIEIHADDYDDTQLAVAKDRVYGLLTHPTAPVLPAILAIGQAGARSGRDVMLAYQIGVEVECKIAEAIAPRHYEAGFHSTGTCGVFGSSAAAAKLHLLDTWQTANALGIASAQAGGLRENFGTMTKPFQAGHAAEAGVIAADLAALGFTASEQILEAPRGFFQAAGGGFDLNAILPKLGNPWTFASPGVSIKPFPSGSLTHPGMTEMLRLIKANNISATQVESVDVGTNRNMPNALIHHDPKSSLQAKFSMEFCMAALLLYGKAGLNQFTDEVVNRPEVQAMIKRIHFGVNPIAEQAGYNKMTTIIDIHLNDRRTISGRADFGKGSPAIPMSYDEVAAKFEDCAAFAKWRQSKAKAIIDMVAKLEDITDVRSLALLCATS